MWANRLLSNGLPSAFDSAASYEAVPSTRPATADDIRHGAVVGGGAAGGVGTRGGGGGGGGGGDASNGGACNGGRGDLVREAHFAAAAIGARGATVAGACATRTNNDLILNRDPLL